MSTLYALDPGPTQSGLVCVEPDGRIIGNVWDNEDLLSGLRQQCPAWPAGLLVIEQVESFGMPVGAEVFETVFWSGRFAQAWLGHGALAGYLFSRIGRKTVKLTLCGTVKAKDANIRQALIDLYGGSACIKKGGALAGIKSHLWSALALAETHKRLHTDASAALMACEGGGQ